MARDCIGQAGAQHDELLLALAFGRADGTPYRIVQTPELALGARIHVAHSAHDAVRLVVEVEGIGDELFEVDFRRAFESSALAAAPVVRPAAFAALAARMSAAAFSP